MPAAFLMKWEGKQRLWRKMYRGTRHHISCRQLSEWAGSPVPETKEGSYQIANAWWSEKKRAIDGEPIQCEYAEEVEVYKGRLDWARRNGDERMAKLLGAEIQRLMDGKTPAGAYKYIYELTNCSNIDELLGTAGLAYGEDVESALDTFDPVWRDRLKRDNRQSVPDDKTVGSLVEKYLRLKKSRVDADALSVSEYDTIRRSLHRFRDWIGSESSVDRLKADKWEEYWAHLIAWERSFEHRKKTFGVAREFVEWLASKAVIAMPPNLNSRKYRFKGAAKAVRTMTIDEVRRLVAEAPGQLKLHLLLMVNCGMTQIDISDLRSNEVNWEKGRIIRKRSKTGDMASVPIVDYPLWPGTWSLLQRYRQPGEGRVLLTETGLPWRRDSLKADGKRSKTDAIRSNSRHLQIRLGLKKSPKLLRNTSASLLATHDDFNNLVEHFLGHSPRRISERHYVRPPEERFDRAIEWLGQKYGFAADV